MAPLQPLAPLVPTDALAGAVPAESAVAPAVPGPAERAKATEAAVKFEGLFIREMLKQMRRGAREIGGDESLSGRGSQEGLLDVADTLVADALAGQRAFGIADAILQQLLPPAPPLPPPSSGESGLKFRPTGAALPSP